MEVGSRMSGRIVALLEHASVGGGTLVAADLLSEWASDGVDVAATVLGRADEGMRRALGANGPVTVLGVEGHVRRLVALRPVLRDLGRRDVLFAVGDYCGLLAAATAATLPRSRRPRIVIGEHQPRPLVAAVRDARGPAVAAVVAAVEAVLRRRTAGSVLTAAEQLRSAAAWRRAGRPGVAIPNPIRVAPADQASIVSRIERLRRGGQVRLISIGALNPQKDHANLIAAVRRLDVRFTVSVIGRGEVDVAGLAAREPSIEDRVAVLGGRDEVVTELDAHDVLVLASRWETAYPLVVVEAIARGLPVVATRCSPVMEAFAAPLPSVTTVPVADPAALAAAIASVAAHPPDADELERAAHDLTSRHDPARAASDHLAFFAELAGR